MVVGASFQLALQSPLGQKRISTESDVVEECIAWSLTAMDLVKTYVGCGFIISGL